MAEAGKASVRDGSATEHVLRALDRISAAPELGAFWSLDGDRALNRARQLDELSARGGSGGRLHGQLVAWKDCFDVAGLPTTAGAPWREGTRPARRNAAVVQRFEDEGAIILGKLAMTQLAWGMRGQTPGRETCRNPHDLARIPGGSSSGSAIAVSAGFVDHAPGTDSGGSIRQPAAFCGVVGFKPTLGSVPLAGCLPCIASLDTAGPIARSVADAAAAFAVLSGRGRQAVPSESHGFRFGLLVDDLVVDHTPPALLAPVLRLAEELGAVPVKLGWTTEHEEALQRVYAAEGAALVYANDAAPAAHRYVDSLLVDIAVGALLSRSEVREARALLSEARETCRQSVQSVDVVIGPTTLVPALLLDGSADSPLLGRLTRPFNALGWPAISLPCGRTEDGLPIGLQLASTAGRDADLLQAAARIERLLDIVPPPFP